MRSPFPSTIQEAFEEALERCSTDHAPWYVIPADQKWYRNLAVARVLVGTLREMNPDFPSVVHDVSHVVIE